MKLYIIVPRLANALTRAGWVRGRRVQPREAGTVPRAKAAAAAKAVTSTYMSKKEQKSLKEVISI
jgi:hypothetical protein